jgi:tetratricopeptide (TPR) repeat protein
MRLCHGATLWVALVSTPSLAYAQEAPRQPASGEEANFENGMRALVEDNLFRAATIFDAMLRKDARDANAYIGLSEVQVRGGHLEEADVWLARGMAVRPGDGNLYRARAQVASLRHRNADAASFLSRAIVLDPRNPQDEIGLARLYEGPLNDPVQALMHYRAAVALAPGDAELQYDYAVLLTKLRPVSEALSALALAQRLAPLNPMPSVVAARLHAKRGATGQALAMLDAALRIRPGLVAAELLRADLLRHAGRYDGAASSYQTVLRQERDSVVALDGLARISADRGRNLAQAAVWSRRAIQLCPDDAALRDTLGSVHLRSGKPALAEQALRAGLMLKPSASLYYHLGLAAAGRGKMMEAQQYYAKALALQPWLAEAQTALWTLTEKAAGDVRRARKS